METPSPRWSRAGRLLALVAFLASLAVAGYLATADSWGSSSGQSVAAHAGTTVVTAWTAEPEPSSDNEWVMKFWAAVLVALTLASLVAALRGLVTLLWVGAGLLTALTILGLASIGLFVAPVAVLLLLGGVSLTVGRGRPSRP